MESGQTRDRGDLVSAVTELIRHLGVAGVVALIAEVTEQQADYLLLSGERQKATRCMRDVRVLQRAAQMLEK